MGKNHGMGNYGKIYGTRCGKTQFFEDRMYRVMSGNMVSTCFNQEKMGVFKWQQFGYKHEFFWQRKYGCCNLFGD